MKVRFLEPAQREFENSVDFYKGKNYGLGIAFAKEILNLTKRIAHQPNSFIEISSNIRRAKCKRFPFGLIYKIENDAIVIIAVMHLHRKPNYWNNRLN